MRTFSPAFIAAAFALAAVAAPSRAGEAPAARAAADFEAARPEKKDGFETWVITSGYQATPCNLYVLLPSAFNPATRYKVLYVLPAWSPGNDGMAEVRKLGLADRYGIICVGPEVSGMPWYGDNPDDPKVRNDSYLPDVIVPFVDSRYPTVAAPEGRVLVGFSKSGVGAVSLLLRHPEVFGRAGSWDAPLTEDETRPEYYGSQENFTANYYIPGLLAARAELLADRPARIAVTGRGWGGTAGAHELMNRLGIPHYVDESLGGAHEWGSGWLAPLVEVLMSPDMSVPLRPDTPANKELSL